MEIRNVTENDYSIISGVLNSWWGGRHMTEMLPRLFFQHFQDTSFCMLDDNDNIVGFLIGFISQSRSNEAYIHFVGVHPEYRGMGIGGTLYKHFFETLLERFTRIIITCVTSPINTTSIAFHQKMGFVIQPSGFLQEDIPVFKNYDGGDQDRIVFKKKLSLKEIS
jgi:ribosomal protein S18 acetylase RimI-like enzyme